MRGVSGAGAALGDGAPARGMAFISTAPHRALPVYGEDPERQENSPPPLPTVYCFNFTV
jgi:hypothetical protein